MGPGEGIQMQRLLELPAAIEAANRTRGTPPQRPASHQVNISEIHINIWVEIKYFQYYPIQIKFISDIPG